MGPLTRPGSNLAKVRMLLRILHVEQGLGLAETARDVVLGLVRVPAVNLWELGGIADKQHGRRDPDDGTCSPKRLDMPHSIQAFLSHSPPPFPPPSLFFSHHLYVFLYPVRLLL